MRRAQQPLCMILPEPLSWRATPVMVNDRPEAASGYWRVIDAETDELLASGPYSVGAESVCELAWFEHRPQAMQILILEWDDGRETFRNHALLGNAPYDFARYRKCHLNF